MPSPFCKLRDFSYPYHPVPFTSLFPFQELWTKNITATNKKTNSRVRKKLQHFILVPPLAHVRK